MDIIPQIKNVNRNIFFAFSCTSFYYSGNALESVVGIYSSDKGKHYIYSSIDNNNNNDNNYSNIVT